jgi:hypothetical protein
MGTHVFFFNPPTLWSNHRMVRHSIRVKVLKKLWDSYHYCLILIWMLNFPIHSFQLLNILSQPDHRTPHNKILQRKGDMPWANEGIPRSMADWEEEIPAFVLCLGLKQHWWEAQIWLCPTLHLLDHYESQALGQGVEHQHLVIQRDIWNMFQSHMFSHHFFTMLERESHGVSLRCQLQKMEINIDILALYTRRQCTHPEIFNLGRSLLCILTLASLPMPSEQALFVWSLNQYPQNLVNEEEAWNQEPNDLCQGSKVTDISTAHYYELHH